ncbi:hypothetical protein BDZ91DRAFT_709084 [Kalaharituber pfeilii]|nr:hypothetical protein BDZ91DRAFT_709084 [Kalaharituber pfeilii]
MGGVIDPGALAAQTAWRGDRLPLHMIPFELFSTQSVPSPSKGAVFCFSAGTYATVISKVRKFVIVRLKSGQVRKVAPETVGIRRS